MISPDNYNNLPLYNELEKLNTGTLVVWEEIDKMQKTNFSEVIDNLRKHLSLVFHKFLEGTAKGKKLRILINNNPIKPFNPFNPNHAATQEIGLEKIKIYNSSIIVQPYILPHHSKISYKVTKNPSYAMYEGFFYCLFVL